MSKVTNIVCDAPKCMSVKGSFNNWWVLRETVLENAFVAIPMKAAGNIDGDKHICSSKCLHDVMETWAQSHTDQPAKPTGDPNYA